MSDNNQNMSVWGFLKGFGKLIIGLLFLLQGLIGLIVLLMVVGLFAGAMNGISGGKDALRIPDGAALVLDPKGILVEQAEVQDPIEKAIEEAYGASDDSQVEIHDLVRAVRAAKKDERIKAIVLNMGSLGVPSSSASKLHYLADELDAFKAEGKKIYAVGDGFSQAQYLLAARADKIIMNDYGGVVLFGYGRYGAYLKSFLEKMKVTTHVFRVGTFKSAVEPFLRDDMSEEAKAANLAYMNVLWDHYAKSVAAARGKTAQEIKAYADNYASILQQSGGDMARAALNYGLVDELKTRPEQLAFLKETFGADKEGKSFKQVTYARYLAAIGDIEDSEKPDVAVVTVAGTIVDGESPAGTAAGGDTIAKYLKKALEEDDVKAVVLRVDSGGGSAFASEVMREGILALKEKGKPVVVSMGSLAASGGYWVSAPADEIWAAPTTITGSIGIFGLITTFEKAAEHFGIYVDGVGTTTLSPILAAGLGPMPEVAKDVIQQSIENGYDRFMDVVSEGRGLDRDYVDQVGQGRVWIGEKALSLKLVDKLGTIDDAVAAAAQLAELEAYDQIELIEKISPFEKLFGGAAAQAMKMTGMDRRGALSNVSAFRKIVAGAEKELQAISHYNDPNGAYARCLGCEGQ